MNDPNQAPPPGGFGYSPPAQGPGYVQQIQPPNVSPQHAENLRRGAELVKLSTWLLFGGFLVMLAGCGLAVGVGAFGFGGVLLGIVVIVASAIVGQIGRGLQGRIL